MVRIRTTGGALTPLQLRAIPEISSRYGKDAIHITPRRDFQIQDIAVEALYRSMDNSPRFPAEAKVPA